MDKELIEKISCWNLVGKSFIEAKQRIEKYLITREKPSEVNIHLSKCGINFGVVECNPRNIEVSYEYIEIESDDCSFYMGCYSCKYDYLTGEKISDYFKIEEYGK